MMPFLTTNSAGSTPRLGTTVSTLPSSEEDSAVPLSTIPRRPATSSSVSSSLTPLVWRRPRPTSVQPRTRDSSSLSTVLSTRRATGSGMQVSTSTSTGTSSPPSYLPTTMTISTTDGSSASRSTAHTTTSMTASGTQVTSIWTFFSQVLLLETSRLSTMVNMTKTEFLSVLSLSLICSL